MMPKSLNPKLTSQKTQKLQDEIFRKMTPEKRLHIAGEMYDFAKKVVARESGERIYERIRKANQKINQKT